MQNKSPEIKSLTLKPTKLMVFLHGLGSDGNDLISLVPFMQTSLPEYYFVSPHGLEPYDMALFGRQWFSLRDRTPSVLLKLARNNVPKIVEHIALKQKELGITNKDTVLFGFSQGTMIGINLVLSQKNPYKAMIAFSGRLIPPETLNNTKTPMCIIHGSDDDIVDANESKKLAKYCEENNIEHELLIIPNLNHSIDTKGIEFALNFLKNLNN